MQKKKKKMFGIMFYNVNKRNYEFGYFDVCVYDFFLSDDM